MHESEWIVDVAVVCEGVCVRWLDNLELGAQRIGRDDEKSRPHGTTQTPMFTFISTADIAVPWIKHTYFFPPHVAAHFFSASANTPL